MSTSTASIRAGGDEAVSGGEGEDEAISGGEGGLRRQSAELWVKEQLSEAARAGFKAKERWVRA